MRVAIVHEWLITLGGSELVLAELLKVFPDADVFTLIDRMDRADRIFLGVGRATTSLLDHAPGARRHHRWYLPFFPMAVRSLDVRNYDVVISNSHAVAKGVRTHSRQLHLSYCLSPMRYAWDLRDQYLGEVGLDRGLRGVLVRAVLERIRRWDLANSDGVDVFATLSHFIADRIRRAYGREATVVYPPVDTEFFFPASGAGGSTAQQDGAASRDRYYVTASRFVPYKRVDLIARAFAMMGDRQLVIIGDGPDATKIQAAAGPGATVRMVGHCSREELREWLRGARAFIFAAEEDFGIAPVEAQACGTPVIAFGKGGATETVRSVDDPDCGRTATGLFFAEQSTQAIIDAVRRFEALPVPISPHACRANAERFSAAHFRDEIRALVLAEWSRYEERR
jgi:glycosyltransferase involved in cell wall biosynthesis